MPKFIEKIFKKQNYKKYDYKNRVKYKEILNPYSCICVFGIGKNKYLEENILFGDPNSDFPKKYFLQRYFAPKHADVYYLSLIYYMENDCE